jgi:Synergist-CTERM protein sorting domain-containing protein
MTRAHLMLLAALLAAPSLAAAQVLTITESNDQDVIVNVAECSGQVTDLLSFTWSSTTTTTTGTFNLLASDQASCPTPTSNSTTTAHTITIQAGLTGTSLTNVIAVPSVLTQLSISCPGPATVVNFCVTDGATTTIVASGTLQLDLQTPPAPAVNSVSGGDSALNVTWSLGSGSADAGTAGAATGFNVYCDLSPAVRPIAKKCASVTGGGTSSTRIGGLTNGVDYDVEVTALSAGGNESPHSDPVTGRPLEVNDFWRLYRNDGGREQGGCATGAAGLVALIALTPLALRRRRRRP